MKASREEERSICLILAATVDWISFTLSEQETHFALD
jgi:hypothetical protein